MLGCVVIWGRVVMGVVMGSGMVMVTSGGVVMVEWSW